MDKHPIVSSNTLFHFTNKREHLLNILANNFHARYCLETFNDLYPVSNPEIFDFAFPMVCFCDLPLSNTSKHLATYGNYGIGLTKDWGKLNALSPVLYVHKESPLWVDYMSVCVSVAENYDNIDESHPVVDKLGNIVSHILCYIKAYEGNFWRQGEEIKDIRFYDEREWRYIPTSLDFDYLYLSRSDFFDKDKLEDCNNFLSHNTQLRFTPDDIRYIIVEREDEILPLMRDIENLKSQFSFDQVRLLLTRIISAEQIREDF